MPTLIRLDGETRRAGRGPLHRRRRRGGRPAAGDVIISLTRFQAEGERPAGRGPRGRRAPASRRGRSRPWPTTCRSSRWWRWCSRSSATAGAYSAARVCCASGSASSGEVRAVGDVLREQARLHGPLRLRRLRAGGRLDRRKTGTGPPTASVTSTSAPPTAAAGLRGAGRREPGLSIDSRAGMPDAGRARWTRELRARRTRATILRGRRRDASATSWRWSRPSARSRRCCCTWPPRSKPDIPVLFLDTGMLFGQTLDYRQQLAAQARPDRRARPAPGLSGPGRPATPRRPLARPTPTPAATSARCCRWTGRSPDFDGWITGRKRFHGGDAPAPAGGRGRPRAS